MADNRLSDETMAAIRDRTQWPELARDALAELAEEDERARAEWRAAHDRGVALLGMEERPLSRRERLELAHERGKEVCPSCGYEHPLPRRNDKGAIVTTPCAIDEHIWNAVVDVVRGGG